MKINDIYEAQYLKGRTEAYIEWIRSDIIEAKMKDLPPSIIKDLNELNKEMKEQKKKP